jgi:hypothetical protein
MFSDFVLWIVGAFLLATIAAFLIGHFPYPFGIIVLSILFVARILHRKKN